jgi:hypothetical protein
VLGSLRKYLRAAIIVPFNGIVTERNVHPGSLVGSSNSASGAVIPMLRLEKAERLRLCARSGKIRPRHRGESRSVDCVTAMKPQREEPMSCGQDSGCDETDSSRDANSEVTMRQEHAPIRCLQMTE